MSIKQRERKSCSKSSNRTCFVGAILLLFLTSSFILFLPSQAHATVIQFTKTGPATARVGDTITYEFTVKIDTAGETLKDAKVFDPLFGAGWSHNLEDIARGKSKSFKVHYKIKESDPNPLKNTAEVSGYMGGAFTYESASCEVEIKGKKKPKISLKKTGPATAKVGDTITYEFTVKNKEPNDPLRNAKVTDPLFGAGWSKELGTIEPGGEKTFTKDYIIKDNDPDPLKNTAEIAGTVGGVQTSKTASHEVDIESTKNASIQVSKTGPQKALTYETINYTIAVHNTGEVDLTDVTVTDQLFGKNWKKKIGFLAAGAADYFHVKYRVKPDDPNPLINTASVTGKTEDGRTVTDDTQWTVYITGKKNASVEVSKTGPPDALTYESITYTIAVHNTGQVDLKDVTVTDALIGSGWKKNIGSLPAGAADYFHVNYTVKPGDPGPLINTAQVTAQTEDGRTVTDDSRWTVKRPGTLRFMPNVNTNAGYQTYIGVLNTGVDSTYVSARFYGTGGMVYHQGTTVLPYTRTTFHANDTPDMPPGDYSAVIASEQPIVVSQSTFGSYQGQLPVAYGSNGVSESGHKFYLPNVCTRQGYYDSILVQNQSWTYNANVTTTYYGIYGDSYTQSAPVPARTRYTFAAPDTPVMPPGDYSAVVESDQPIVVSQSTFGNFNDQYGVGYGSNGVDELSTGTKFYLPNVSTRSGYFTYTAVQNVGDTSTNVSATYYDTSGGSYQQSATVHPNARHTFVAQDTPAMPAGDYSVVIESDRPIVVSQSTFSDYKGRGLVSYSSGGIGEFSTGTKLYLPNVNTQSGYSNRATIPSLQSRMSGTHLRKSLPPITGFTEILTRRAPPFPLAQGIPSLPRIHQSCPRVNTLS